MESKKRCAEEADDADGGRKKRGRRSEEEEDDEEDVRAGIIEKITMKNFMCHSSLEVSLNKNINFLVGRNGSGKSAILSAVVVALGSKASATNRASSLKDFIKKGAHSAVVQVTLSNVGLSAYKQELYGNKITICRTLYTNTTPAAFKIKSEKGEVISTKREELNKIISSFNIQVDNPVSILNQDTARTFLAASDPKMKYAIFMKATRLEDVNNLHAVTISIEEEAQRKLQTCLNNLKQSDKEVKLLEERWQHLQKLKNCQERMTAVENELYWAQASEEERILASLKRDSNHEENQVQSLHKRFDKFNNKLLELTHRTSNLEEDVKKSTLNMQEIKEKYSTSKEREKVSKQHYAAKLRTYRDMKNRAGQHAVDIQTVKQEMEKIRDLSSTENVSRRNSILEHIASLSKEQQQLFAMQRTTDQDYQKLTGEGCHFQENFRTLKATQSAVVMTVQRKRSELMSLKNQSNNNLSLFGQWMPLICRRVEETYQRGKFKRKPLGPVGHFLKLRDERWAQAVENELGLGLLKSFFCHCKDDAFVLKKIMAEVIKGDRVPAIIVSRFQDKVYNIRETRVQARTYSTLFEMLEISDVNIANCLIDQKQTEAVLLIPTREEAQKLMSVAGNVPKNCMRAITLDGDLYYPYPEYRTYASSRTSRAHLLQVSMQDGIRNLEEEIVSEEQTMGELNLQINELRGHIEKNSMERRAVQLKKADIEQKAADVESQIKDLKDSLESQSGNMQALTTELKELESKLCQLNDEEKILDEETKSSKQEMAAAEKKSAAIIKQLNEEEDKKKELMLQITQVNEEKRSVELSKSEVKKDIEKNNTKIREAQTRYDQQKERTEKALQDALKLHPQRVESERDIPQIKKELNACRSYVNSAERETGAAVDVTEKLVEKKRAFRKNTELVNAMKKGLKILNVSLASRKELYKMVRKAMALRVVYMFQPLLKQRGYRGVMKFDHEGRKLIVEASPATEAATRETKSLSGGERSYSTVAFILSLWECVEPPFYFLDEFDVFMDKINRRCIMELLLHQARMKNRFQYVFLTPQDTSDVKGAQDITIHQLDDPERTYEEMA